MLILVPRVMQMTSSDTSENLIHGFAILIEIGISTTNTIVYRVRKFLFTARLCFNIDASTGFHGLLSFMYNKIYTYCGAT